MNALREYKLFVKWAEQDDNAKMMEKAMTNHEEEMRAALEAIWEMEEYDEEPYDTIREMQRRALIALERCGYVKPYYTKEDHSS